MVDAEKLICEPALLEIYFLKSKILNKFIDFLTVVITTIKDN